MQTQTRFQEIKIQVKQFDSLRNGESDTKRNTQSQNEMNRTGLTKQYLIDNLQKLYSMRDTIFKTYDKECFLHIW